MGIVMPAPEGSIPGLFLNVSAVRKLSAGHLKSDVYEEFLKKHMLLCTVYCQGKALMKCAFHCVYVGFLVASWLWNY